MLDSVLRTKISCSTRIFEQEIPVRLTSSRVELRACSIEEPTLARVVALALSATTTQVAVWTALECSIAIIVACCPALRGLFQSPESRKFPGSSGGSGQVRHLPGNTKSQGVDKTNECPRTENVEWKDNANLGLVMSGNAKFILKNIDFEIMSETASQTFDL